MQIDKVIRIGLDSDLFYDLVSYDLSEWWFNLDDLKENKPVYKIVKNDYPEIIEALEQGAADYLSIYSDN